MGDHIELLEYPWCVDQLLVLDPPLVRGGRMVFVGVSAHLQKLSENM